MHRDDERWRQLARARARADEVPDPQREREHGMSSFLEHRPPWLGPAPDARLMRSADPYPQPPGSRAPERAWRVPDILRMRRWRPRVERTDERIHDDVCHALAHDGWVDATDIVVRVEGQRVRLSGEVRDREQKWRAEDIAEHVLGVTAVIDEIRVRRGRADPTGAR